MRRLLASLTVYLSALGAPCMISSAQASSTNIEHAKANAESQDVKMQATAMMANPNIGININGVRDWSTEFAFTDIFKQSRRWLSANAADDGPFDTQLEIPTDRNGFPLEIPYSDGIHPPQKVKTLMMVDVGPITPLGQYRIKASGSGRIRLSNGARGTYDCPVDTLVDYTGGQVQLEILESDASNPVRDIKFVFPDYVNTYESQTFTNEFLEFLQDFSLIRFMDFTGTNGSPVKTWSERTLPSNHSQGVAGGVAWEHVVELANLTQKDLWINIPHQADDDYIEKLANLLQDTVRPELQIYVEYSNELWNGIFPQNRYGAEQATLLGYTGDPWERTWKYTVRRSADIFKIFEDVFDDDDRLVKVIASQAAVPWLSNRLMTFFGDPAYNPHGVTADALAIAPYIGGHIADDLVKEGRVGEVTVEEIVERLNESQAEALEWIVETKVVADRYNLDMIAYEGGQHLVATRANVNNRVLTQKLIAANRHPAMQQIYCSYYNSWYENGGSLFANFASHKRPTKWGSWGIRENFQDVNNPKYLGLKNCVFNRPDPNDATAPTRPSGLSAANLGNTSVALRWDVATDEGGGPVRYEVRRGDSVVAEVVANEARLSGLAPATDYGFTVVAIDAVGNRSPASETIRVTTSATALGAPAIAPMGLMLLVPGLIALGARRRR